MTTATTTDHTPLAPILNIVGEKVALGPQSSDHVPLIARWVNDFEVALYSGDALKPTAVELHQAEHEKASKEWQSHRVGFTIYERATLRPIGIAEWRHIDGARRTADYGILIGEKDCWGKGYGTETTRLMLDYAFTALNLHSVMLTTASYNARAIGAYTKAGFREFGRWRESLRLGDRVYDDVFMECLASEFQPPARGILERP
ncbi:MAG TPA: GNAT family protein [Ktedonobacterales bacterium]